MIKWIQHHFHMVLMVIQFQSISTRQNRQKQYNADPRTESLIHLSERTLYVLDNVRFFLFLKERKVFKSTPACAWDIKVYWLWRHRNTALLWRIPRRFKLIYSRVDCVTHPCVTMNVRRFPWVIDIRYLAGDLLFFDHVLHIHYT